MNVKKFLDYIGTSLICIFVASQFISCEKTYHTEEKYFAKKLENTWTDLKAKNLVSGTILIMQDNKVLFSDGSLDTKYAISSISKSFVGWRYFQLQQQGFALDTPVCRWLKNFCAGNFKNITVQMLLDHTSGIGKDLSLLHFLKRTFSSQWSIANFDNLELSDDYLKSKPGQEFLYSNFGYLVLSRLLEVIEHKSFSNIMKEIFQESGLTTTSVIAEHDVLPISILMPFTKSRFSLSTETILFSSAGAGGIKSSATDMAKWLNFLMLNNFQKIFAGSDTQYRHGMVHIPSSSYQAFWHNGASLGAYSLIAFLPKSKLRIVLLTDNFKFTKQWTQEVEQFEKYLY
ncbi:MAG: serine hydrolase domain-containing protein [Bdellovibrio sp.]